MVLIVIGCMLIILGSILFAVMLLRRIAGHMFFAGIMLNFLLRGLGFVLSIVGIILIYLGAKNFFDRLHQNP